jgi:hypothetical protein
MRENIREENFICPISLDIMEDPVIALDGVTYDRSSITEWLEYHTTSPMTRQEIGNTLIPNRLVKDLIEQYKASINALLPEVHEEQDQEGLQTLIYSDLLDKLAACLKINRNQVTFPHVVTQALVGMSTIFTYQSNAMFYPEENTGIKFMLNFKNNSEYQRFLISCRDNYAGSILQQGNLQEDLKTWVIFDRKVFCDAICPALGDFKDKYSLQNIMVDLARLLQVDFKEVYIGGDAVERRLVGKAGICTSQKQARYARGADYSVVFYLAFDNAEEHTQFVSYYTQNYTNFITRDCGYEAGKLSRIEVNSIKLLSKIAPTLGADLDPKHAEQQGYCVVS